MPQQQPKRLIEVAMPIREISAESVRDKSLRHGHPCTLHLWWARRPLAAGQYPALGLVDHLMRPGGEVLHSERDMP